MLLQPIHTIRETIFASPIQSALPSSVGPEVDNRHRTSHNKLFNRSYSQRNLSVRTYRRTMESTNQCQMHQVQRPSHYIIDTQRSYRYRYLYLANAANMEASNLRKPKMATMYNLIGRNVVRLWVDH